MSNQITEARQPGALVAQEGRMSVQHVVEHVRAVQEVMRSVMRDGIHYGKIPGTDKPTLLQPGADLLCMTFRIAQKFIVEDLSTPDAIRYRVTCLGVHQITDMQLGAGIGEASSAEEKYKWRRAASPEEFDNTPSNMKRVKYAKSWKANQVRTEPADAANTVLKMAAKRAKTAMVLNVTAASDMFGQDMEDLDAALRESLVAADAHVTPDGLPACRQEDLIRDLPKMQKMIDSGSKTAEDLLTMMSTRAKFTEAQRAQILALKQAPNVAAPPADAPKNQPAPTAPAGPAQVVSEDFVEAMDAAERAAGENA